MKKNWKIGIKKLDTIELREENLNIKKINKINEN